MISANFSRLADTYGYPFYLYDEASVASQLSLLRETMPDFTILYSIKTNPHPAICRFMAANGAGADAASSYEVKKSLEAGFPPDLILYSAPGKSVAQMKEAFGASVLVADSYSELERLDELAGDGTKDRSTGKIPVGLRINPALSFGAGERPEVLSGSAGKFGVDEEGLLERRDFFQNLRHIRPAGIHVFLRSQVLSHEAIASSFEAIFKLALFCRQSLGWDMSFINFGGGFGITPGPDYPALDTGGLRDAVGAIVARYKKHLPGVRLYLESGRFLVGKAGMFVTRIEDIKESRGKTFVIAPGGLNGFLRPAVMNLLNGLPFDVPGPFEPLYSNGLAHQVTLPEKKHENLRVVTVCGNMCTALDVMAKDVSLPEPESGDIVAVSNAGAYAASLSPFAFASFPRPPELYLKRDGGIVIE